MSTDYRFGMRGGRFDGRGSGGPADERAGRSGPMDDRGGRGGPLEDRARRGEPLEERGGRSGPMDDREDRAGDDIGGRSGGTRGGRNDDRGGRGGPADERAGRSGPMDDRGGRGGPLEDRARRGEPLEERGGRSGPMDDREDRDGDDIGGRGGGREGGLNDDKRGRQGRGRGRFGSSERDRSPLRGDRLRGAHMDSYHGGEPRPLFPPGGRDPFGDPFRDPYRSRAPPPPPPTIAECEIFFTNAQLRVYVDTIEKEVQEHRITTAVSVMADERSYKKRVAKLSNQNALFAIFINTQNEIHRSLTLNILHAHRNIQVSKAIKIVGEYMDDLRKKAQAAAVTTRRGPGPVSIPEEVAYLLNLLADKQVLVVGEINSVIKYLEDRRDKMVDVESRPIN